MLESPNGSKHSLEQGTVYQQTSPMPGESVANFGIDGISQAAGTNL
jgi:hypothetical protein